MVRFQGKEVAASVVANEPKKTAISTPAATTSKTPHSGRRVASLKQNFTGKSSGAKKTTTLPASELYRKKLLSLQQKSLKQFKSVASKTSSWKSKHTPEGYQNKQQMPPLVMTKSKAVANKTVKTVKTLKPVPSSPSAGKVSTSRIEDDDRLLIPAVREASNNNQDSLLLLQSSVGNLPVGENTSAPLPPPTTVAAPFEAATSAHRQQPIARAVSTRALQSGVAVLPPSSGAGGVHSLFPQNTGDAEVDEVLRQIAGNLNTTTSNSNISSGKQPSSSSQTSLATIPEEDYGKYSGGGGSLTNLSNPVLSSQAQDQQQQQQKAQQQKQQQLAFLREQEHFYRALLQQQQKKNCAPFKLVAKPEEKEEEKEDQLLELSSSEEQLLARQQKLIAGQKALLAAFEAEPLPKEEPPPLQKLVNTAEETAAEHRANRYAVQVLLGTIASLMVIAAALFAFRE